MTDFCVKLLNQISWIFVRLTSATKSRLKSTTDTHKFSEDAKESGLDVKTKPIFG